MIRRLAISAFATILLASCATGAPPNKSLLPQDRFPVLKTSYDEFKDQTTTMSFSFLGSFKTLILMATAKGRDATNAPVISMVIEEDSKVRKHKNPTLILLIDGKRNSVEGLLSEAKVKQDKYMGVYYEERVLAPLTARGLQVIANAATVRGQLSFSEFEFSPDVLTNIRNFAARVGADKASGSNPVAKDEGAETETPTPPPAPLQP